MDFAFKLLTLKQAASELGLQYHHIQRAAKRGDIPSYKPFGKRPMVRLSEVIAFIYQHRVEVRK